MNPPFTYYGGKVGLAPAIVRLMPPHRVYMEPFFGSGAVLFHKPPARFELVNDLDDNVVTFFKVLREQPDELERLCLLSPHARTEFAAAAVPAVDELEKARRFWVRVNQSFAKTAGPRTGWSTTTARTQSIPDSIRSRISRFAAVAERLMRVTFENGDAVDFIDRLATVDTVIYADPPYLATTRRSTHGKGSDYAHDMGDLEAHTRLAEALHRSPATVLLSGYPSEQYDALYADWWRIEYAVTTYSSNSRRDSRGARTEVVWSNRQLDRGQLALGGS